MAKKTINNVNVVELDGVITKILSQSDKVTKFIVDSQKTSKTGSIIHTYMSVIQFKKNDELDVDDFVKVVGSLSTSSYKGKFRVDIIADDVTIE